MKELYDVKPTMPSNRLVSESPPKQKVTLPSRPVWSQLKTTVDLPVIVGKLNVLVEIRGTKTVRTRLWLATRIALPLVSRLMSMVFWVSMVKCEIEIKWRT